MKPLRTILLCSGYLTLTLLWGCQPVERQAYNIAVGAKAFLDSVKSRHPECSTDHTIILCHLLDQATSAKDALITAGETYCSGPQFESGGACQPPDKSSPQYPQLLAKLQSAIDNYKLFESELKGVTK